MNSITTTPLESEPTLHAYISEHSPAYVAFSLNTKALEQLKLVEYSGKHIEIGLFDLNPIKDDIEKDNINDKDIIFVFFSSEIPEDISDTNMLLGYLKEANNLFPGYKMCYGNPASDGYKKYCKIAASYRA